MFAAAAWPDRIAVDPAVCHGQPCVKGTRIMVSVVFDALAAGVSVEDVLASYPSLTAADVSAALACAKERMV